MPHQRSAEGDTRISHSCWLLLASESFGSVALQKFRLPSGLDHWTPELIPKKRCHPKVSNPWVIIFHIWSCKNLFQGLCHSLGSNLPNLAMTHCVQSIKTSAQHGNVEQQYWSRLHHDSFSTSRTTASLLERSISVGQVVY